MKRLTFILLVVLGACSPKTVATITTRPNRVFYSSADIDQVNTADSIAKIRPGAHWLARNIRLTLRNGDSKTIPKKAVWGYSDEKGNVWRRFGPTYYQVLRINDVVEYEIIEPRTAGPSMVIYEPIKKYSKTLDSKIVGSRTRALKMSEEQKTD